MEALASRRMTDNHHDKKYLSSIDRLGPSHF